MELTPRPIHVKPNHSTIASWYRGTEWGSSDLLCILIFEAGRHLVVFVLKIRMFMMGSPGTEVSRVWVQRKSRWRVGARASWLEVNIDLSNWDHDLIALRRYWNEWRGTNITRDGTISCQFSGTLMMAAFSSGSTSRFALTLDSATPPVHGSTLGYPPLCSYITCISSRFSWALRTVRGVSSTNTSR